MPDPAPDSLLASLAIATARVGDRWSPLIAAALLDGPARFADLRRRVAGIAPNILAARLRELQAQGLVHAEAYCARPPRYVYELTESGRGLEDALRALAAWADSQLADDAPGSGHEADPGDDELHYV